MLGGDGEYEKHIVIPEEELVELPLPTYSCEFCGLNVKTRANLRAHHVKTHRILKSDSDVAFYTKQRCPVTYVYHCPVMPCKHNLGCGAGFSTSSRLKQHYQNVHMQKSYKCDKCGCFFSTPSNHAYHLRFCGKVFSCSVCSRRYSFKKHLDQHFRRSGHQPIDKPVKRLKRTVKPPAHHQSCVEIKPNDLPKLVSSIASSTTHPNFISAVGETATVMAPSSALHSSPIILPIIILPIPLYRVEESSQPDHSIPDSVQSYLSDDLVLNQYGYSTSADPTFMSPTECTTIETSNEVTELERCQIGPCIPVEASQYDFACQFDNAFPSSEIGTQTEVVPSDQALAPPETSAASVSVNTCTDEDDISAFIGSLFCDASVETTYPYPNLVHEFTDTGLDELTTADGITLPMQYMTGSDFFSVAKNYAASQNDNGVEHQPDSSSTDTLSFDSMNRHNESDTLYPNVHAEVQTELKSKSHAAAATHDTPVHWSSDTNRLAILETPPPLFGLPLPVSPTTQPQLSSRTTFTSASSSTSQQAHTLVPQASPLGFSSQPINSSHTSATEYCDFNQGYRTYSFPSNISPDALSSHSIGLQSSPWPPANPCSSIASQTLVDDWESWLSSVHTQTNTSPLSLTDMCSTSNDEFLTESFGSPENMNGVASIFAHF